MEKQIDILYFLNTKTYIDEDFKGNAVSINIEQSKIILSQLEKKVCKIYEIGGGKGSGFFCKIPYPDQFHLLPVLITNRHVLDQKDLEKHKNIKLSFNDDKENRNLIIDKNRKIYSCKDIDVTIIEIKPDLDKIYDFLDIDENVFNENYKQIYQKKMKIYIIQYPLGQASSFSIGLLSRIENEKKKIIHKCSTDYGSSGSPILCLNNFKVFGVHKGRKIDSNGGNEGVFIKFAIEEFLLYLNSDIHSINIKKSNHNNSNNNPIMYNNIKEINNNYHNNSTSNKRYKKKIFNKVLCKFTILLFILK